jgi:hypothetical protein
LKNYLALIPRLTVSACLLLLVSCGSSEDSDTYPTGGRRTPLPPMAQVRGAIPNNARAERSIYGGTQLVSFTFSSTVALQPAFDIADVQWGRAQEVAVIQPGLEGCELTGMDIYFENTSPNARVHAWGWDLNNGEACERFFQRVLTEGLTWRAKNLPGVYGDTIRQADFEFPPANRIP